MIKLLVTAFGAFPGAPSNPTLAIARELERRHGKRLARLSVALHIRVLPVRFAEVEGALVAALEAVRPHVVLHLGLAGRRKTLSVELRALNRLGLLRPDAARLCGLPRGLVRRALSASCNLARPARPRRHGPQRRHPPVDGCW